MKKNEKSNKKGIVIGVSALALVLLCGGVYTSLNKSDSKTVSNNKEQTSFTADLSTEETSTQVDTTMSKEEQDKKENDDKSTEATSTQKETQTTTTKKEETTKKQVVTEKQTETTTQATTTSPTKEKATETTTKKPVETTTKEPTTETTTKSPVNNGGEPNYDEMTDDEFWGSLGITGDGDIGEELHNFDFELSGNQIGQ